MKKHDSLPDFQQLCKPEQNHTANLLSLEIFFFFLCSIGGFLWEVILMYTQGWNYVNRGFFYGPWLPIYGVGGVLFHIILAKKNFSDDARPISIWRQSFSRLLGVFFSSLLIGTGLELFIGWFLDTFWALRYWDYSECTFQFQGYICVWSAIGFGIGGMLWICLFSPFLSRLWFQITPKIRRNLNTVLLLLFAFDCAASLIFPNLGNGITFP